MTLICQVEDQSTETARVKYHDGAQVHLARASLPPIQGYVFFLQ